METNSEEVLTYSGNEELLNIMNDCNEKNIEPFIFQNIRYSDKRVAEKLEKIEAIKRKLNSKKVKGKITYMSLFI